MLGLRDSIGHPPRHRVEYEVARDAICEAGVGVGPGLSRIELDPLRVVRDGVVEVAFVTICEAAVEVGTRQVSMILTAGLNDLRAACNRLIVSAVVSIAPSLGWRLLRGCGRNDH